MCNNKITFIILVDDGNVSELEGCINSIENIPKGNYTICICDNRSEINEDNITENYEDVDVDEIKAGLEELDLKHPELNILKVYDLKYKNKNSVSEIASQLGMDEVQVVEALNEMIAVV